MTVPLAHVPAVHPSARAFHLAGPRSHSRDVHLLVGDVDLMFGSAARASMSVLIAAIAFVRRGEFFLIETVRVEWVSPESRTSTRADGSGATSDDSLDEQSFKTPWGPGSPVNSKRSLHPLEDRLSCGDVSGLP